MYVFQGDPVIPAFPDLHLAPASILKELAPYFQKVSAQVRQIGVPLPHELSPREASEYPLQELTVYFCLAVTIGAPFTRAWIICIFYFFVDLEAYIFVFA